MVLAEFRTDLGYQLYDGCVNKTNFPHGYGTLYFPSGAVEYEGQFKHGRFDGQGTLYFNCGRFDMNVLKYCGQFKKGMMWGRGRKFLTRRFFDDVDQQFYFTDIGHYLEYAGTFKESVPHGFGLEYDENHRLRYIGNFKKGQYNGSGVLFQDGRCVYKGLWSKNERHGLGSSYENGIFVFSGLWKHDEKDLCEARQSNAVKLFLETDLSKYVQKIPLRFLRRYLETHYQEKNMQWNRKQVIEKIREKYRANNLPVEDEIENEDLFGNPIVIPCYGSDGGVYDLSSMRYLFQRNSQGDYTNIPYVYDSSNHRVPTYRRMKDGNILSHYSCPMMEEWDMN
ncbi:MAG: hypothetical protein CMM15_15075 [Rhodospirillaceae bacterium]|nr:hypothetical protein [Rhodospirillaceae bacterium]|tara:strand:- start:4744 stop:5757 length:1014 start_codon:yes stop_codon:yes gene_type:complete